MPPCRGNNITDGGNTEFYNNIDTESIFDVLIDQNGRSKMRMGVDTVQI